MALTSTEIKIAIHVIITKFSSQGIEVSEGTKYLCGSFWEGWSWSRVFLLSNTKYLGDKFRGRELITNNRFEHPKTL